MKCPVCETVDLVISERRGVEIDYCPQCRGVWLDRSELDKIIERTIAQEGASPQAGYSEAAPVRKRKNDERPYVDDDDDDRYRQGKGRRRRSFFEDIFDIFD